MVLCINDCQMIANNYSRKSFNSFLSCKVVLHLVTSSRTQWCWYLMWWVYSGALLFVATLGGVQLNSPLLITLTFRALRAETRSTSGALCVELRSATKHYYMYNSQIRHVEYWLAIVTHTIFCRTVKAPAGQALLSKI